MSSQREATEVHVSSVEGFSRLLYTPETALLIAEDATAFTNFSRLGAVGTLLKVSEDGEALIRAVADARMSKGGESSFEVSIVSGTVVQKVTAAVLPRKVSRHNAPSRSHNVTEIVRANKGSRGNLVIFLLPTKREYVFPQVCAAARPFPLFAHRLAAQAQRRVDIVIEYPSPDPAADLLDVQKLNNVVQGLRMCQRLVDAPPNLLHSDRYIEECIEVSRAIGSQIQVIKGHELDERGLGGIWGVGKASEHLPALVILSHIPEGTQAGAKSVCLVGKGIIYDTGGLSIKDKTGMPGMKVDMGGSAAVLGAFQAAVLSGSRIPVHALLCIAENSVGPLATRPDDIHTLYSGKTVEINNTDAEGRLVLSDGCAFATRHLNPKVIVDIATLTGAQGIATGKKHAALYCSDEWLEALAIRCGQKSGDLTHPLPYCPEFFKPEFASVVADMKNSVKDRSNAQSSCAGQFIGNHIEV
jgi:probable aminopeptidase NPEPL1